MRALLALLALLVAVAPAPAHAQKPTAERPTYAVGDRWAVSGVAYELASVEGDTYVFTASGGNEIHLTKNLAITKVLRQGRILYELEVPHQWPWPLTVGKWVTKRIAIRRAPDGATLRQNLGGGGLEQSGAAQVNSTVAAYEDVTVPAGRFKAFKITDEVLTVVMPAWRTTSWYSPDLRRIVKSESTAVSLNFELTDERPPAVASTPAPVRPEPTIPRVEPTPAPPPSAAREKSAAAAGPARPAERPAYSVGDRWIVSGVAYELARIERESYVFTASGGNEIHLTKDLGVAKIVRNGRSTYDVPEPQRWPWPMTVGKWTRSRTRVATIPDGARVAFGGNVGQIPPSGDCEVISSVEAYEDVTLPTGRIKAFKVTDQWRGGGVDIWQTTSWYSPDLRRIVKSQSSTAIALNFELTGADAPPAVASAPAPPPASAKPAAPATAAPLVEEPPSAPPAVAAPAPAPPISRTPPAITLLDPKPGALLRTGETTLKVEVKSDNRLKALIVKGRGGDKTFAPEPGAKAGEPWVVEAKVSLAEGSNTIRLEVVDEHGGRAAETVHLARQSLIAVELEGPPHASVRVDQDQHTLDANGKLTIELAPGRYQIEAAKDGFIALRQALQLDGRQKKVVQKLTLLQLVPPTVTVLSPAAGTVLQTADTKLKIEVKSRYRLSALRLGRDNESAQQTFAPQGSAKAGETWILEPVVLLNEGDNAFKLEAIDEHGTRAEQRLTVTRRIAVAVAPPTDAEAPKVAINYPVADTKVEAESIVILGLITDNVAVDRMQITVNGVEVAQPRDLAVVGRGVPVRVPAALQPGPNVIEITAADKAGNVSQVVRTVTRGAAAVAAPTAPPGPKISNRWAVVVGVGDYDNRTIPKLRFATKDAEAMYQFLTTQGGYPKENVLLLTDTSAQKPTLLNIKRALGDFLARRAGRDDMVLIYFAGHGAPEVDAAGNEADGLSKYLIPRDGDPESLYTTALPMDEIQRIFSRVAAERIVMLLDTCYSGTAGGRTFARASTRATGLNDQFLERLTRSRGRVIMTASGPNEVALELPNLGHGVFTYYLLEGLKGKADRNNDGMVTVSELYEYVEDQVDSTARRAGGRQRPLMKGEIEGTLPLAKTR